MATTDSLAVWVLLPGMGQRGCLMQECADNSHAVLCCIVLSCAVQVYDPEVDEDRSFGLLGDSDHLWTPTEREQQKHQVCIPNRPVSCVLFGRCSAAARAGSVV